MLILSSFIHPQAVPNLYACLCYAEHKGRYSEECVKQSSPPLPQGYIPHPPAPAIYSLFVHPLSALNTFLPDSTVPAKYRSCFPNLTFKFTPLKEREIGKQIKVQSAQHCICYFIHLVNSLEFIDFDLNLYNFIIL